MSYESGPNQPHTIPFSFVMLLFVLWLDIEKSLEVPKTLTYDSCCLLRTKTVERGLSFASSL